MKNWLILGFAAVFVFAAVVLIGLRLVPAPHTETDYLVIGSVATFLCMTLLFGALLKTWRQSSDAFFKKRQRKVEPDEGDSSQTPPSESQ